MGPGIIVAVVMELRSRVLPVSAGLAQQGDVRTEDAHRGWAGDDSKHADIMLLAEAVPSCPRASVAAA